MTQYYKATAQWHIMRARTEKRAFSLCGVSNYISDNPPDKWPPATQITGIRPARLCGVCTQLEARYNDRSKRQLAEGDQPKRPVQAGTPADTAGDMGDTAKSGRIRNAGPADPEGEGRSPAKA